MLRLSLLALIVSAAPALAQEELPLIGSLESGFGGFGWGASLEQITTRRGPAVQDTAVAIGRRLTYREQRGSLITTTYYFIHPADGLDKGIYVVPFAPGRCMDLFERLAKEISRTNRDLRPHDRRTGTHLCDSRYAIGHWFRTWGDGNAENIGLSLSAPNLTDQYVRVSYEGPGAVRHIQEGQALAAARASSPSSPPETTSDNRAPTSPASIEPTYDVEGYCAKVAQASGGSYQLEAGCRKQEAEARVRLASFQGVEPRILGYCTNMADQIGRSYWFLVTCIDGELKAKSELR
jgi:hypothetical protein